MEEDEADAKDVTFPRRGRDEFRLPVVSFRARVTRYRKVSYQVCTTRVILLYRCNLRGSDPPTASRELGLPIRTSACRAVSRFRSAASKVQKHR